MPSLKNHKFALLIAAFIAWPFAPALALNSLTVMADNSMSLAVAQIARNYSAQRGVVVSTSFSTQGAQEAQITEGSSVDILITSQGAWVEQLKTRGLIDIYSPTVIAKNQLVLAGPLKSTISFGPKSTALPTAEIINAIGGEPGFVVANPEALMEGGYSKEALHTLDPGDYLAPYTLFIKEPGQMFDMVANHDAYGLFLYSSTIRHAGVKVIGRLPENSYHPIQYVAVVIAGENMDGARLFLEYLKTPQARAILRENGFAIN